MSKEGEGGFQISALQDDDRMTYAVMINRFFPIQSLATVTYDRVLCLYALLTHSSIDYGSFMLSMMMGVRLARLVTSLPYEALVTRIAEHAGESLAEEEQVRPLGAFNSRYLVASRSHLREAELELRVPRAPWVAPRRCATADGASSSTLANDLDRERIYGMLDGLQQSMGSLTSDLGMQSTEFREAFRSIREA